MKRIASVKKAAKAEEEEIKRKKAKKAKAATKQNGGVPRDKQKLIGEEAIEMEEVRAEDDNNDNDQKAMMAALQDDDMGDNMDQKDGGYIELVLRVLARMCDGQHIGLQVS